MTFPPGLLQMIARTRLFTDGRAYVIIRMARGCDDFVLQTLKTVPEPFSALVRDKDEVTLVLAEDVWAMLKPVLDPLAVSTPYRLITFDIPLDLALVGYLATFSSALAEVGISIVAMSAFSRDHILVAVDDFERAWDTLWALIRSCQAQATDS